jgi:hypothetical protein
MKIWFNEQDVIDAACVFVADRYNEPIDRIQAELRLEEGKGIFATASVRDNGRTYELSEQDLIDGTAIYLAEYHNFDPNRLSVELLFEEETGITAVIEKL